MKKIFISSLIALAGLLSVSCMQEHIEVVFDPNKVEGQTLGQIEGCTLAEDGTPLTASYNEADFKIDVPVTYTLLVTASGDSFDNAKKVDATIEKGTITIDQVKLNKVLGQIGAAPETEFAADFRLDACLVNEKGAVESTKQMSNVVTAVFTVFETEKVLDVCDVPGDYQGWAPSDYPKLFNYSGDGTIYRGVVDFQCSKEDGSAANGFKITYGGNWDNDSGNWGSAAQAEAAEAGSVQLVNGDASQNIICYGEKRYYLFSFNKDQLVLTKLMSFDKVGVIGFNGDWDNDIVMTYNMYKGRFWADVDAASATEFKFRLDGAWDYNWGGELDNLSGGGANIPIDAGQYRIYFYMNDETVTAAIDASMYGQEEPTIDEPEPTPVTYEGWGIIGVGGDWEKDIEMTEDGGIWTGYANLTADDSWKLRKDAAWDENFGGTFTALGKPFEAVADGGNIAVGQAGFYKIELNTNDNTITVSDGTVWGVIGDFNEWGKDSFMTETDGVWVSDILDLEAGKGFKIRKNSSWDENRGAQGDVEPFEVTLGSALPVVSGGKNLTVPETGKYVITYDPAAETITVVNGAKSWGVIGDFNGWAGDVVMTEVAPGIWVSPKTTIADGGWKVRFDGGWDVNYGGSTPSEAGKFVQAIGNGENIGLHGDLIVVLNLNNDTIGTLGWGVTGSIASCPGIAWNNDIPMNLTSDGTWVSCPVALTTSDEIKVRFGAGWDENFGGSCTAVDVAFEAVAGGSNIKAPADGTYIVVYDPAAGTLTLSKTFWGLIGDFNSWGADDFMFYAGDGKYYAFNRHYVGGWKIRMSSGWDVNRGGTYVWADPFTVVQEGDNINVGDEALAAAGFNVIYDSKAETITVNQEIIL